MRGLSQITRWLAIVFAVTCGGGCAVLVELSSAPDPVTPLQTVDYEVKVTNQLVCPVGRVFTFVFPLVPKDLRINEIEDEKVREIASHVVDAFCSGREPEIPAGAEADCRLEDEDVICEVEPGVPVAGLATGPGGISLPGMSEQSGATCTNEGGRLRCTFPEELLAEAEAEAMAGVATTSGTIGPLTCGAGDGVAICFALRLEPEEMVLGSFDQQAPPEAGTYRNWAVSFATRSRGVCRLGIGGGAPCNEDSDCVGAINTCGDGICVGGEDEGFGCDDDNECDGGSCVSCRPAPNPRLLSGIDCTNTLVQDEGVMAPALSTAALTVLFLSLLALGWLANRRAGSFSR